MLYLIEVRRVRMATGKDDGLTVLEPGRRNSSLAQTMIVKATLPVTNIVHRPISIEQIAPGYQVRLIAFIRLYKCQQLWKEKRSVNIFIILTTSDINLHRADSTGCLSDSDLGWKISRVFLPFSAR